MNKPTPPLLSGAILVLLTLNLLVILGSSARAQSGRVKWEYTQVVGPRHEFLGGVAYAPVTTAELNFAGNQGWEVVQMQPDHSALCKRRK